MSKGWTVVALVLVVAMAIVAVRFAGSRSMKLDKEDIERSREEILIHIPLGSHRIEAARVLEKQGFACELLDGLVLRDGRRSRALNCSRATWTGIGRWRIGVWLDGEQVEDVTVGYGNTAS